jgi:hypothetical protein
MRIQLLGIGQVSRSPYVTAKSLGNCFAEQRPAGEKSSMVLYQRPGLELFTDFGATPIRGSIEYEAGSISYVVHRGVFYSLNNAGVKTMLGTLLTTSGRVSMASNGSQIMITDGSFGYIYTVATLAFVQITAIGFPANPVTCTFLAGRFVANFVGSSRFYWSDLYDGTLWDALNFANAEANPDPIQAVWASNGQLILLGTVTMEFWGISGTLDAAFISLAGTATEWGLAATWSIAKYDNTMACLIKNRMGQVMVASITGYLPKKISTIDLDSIINGYANTADASSFSFMLGGHPMYVINFPSAGATWLYDGSTGIWSPLKSYGLNRWRIEFSFSFLGRTLGADYDNGRLYEITADALTDNGDSIEREIVGETIASEDLNFLNVDCLRVDMETGIGLTSGQGENPQISLSLSRDNGKTWGAEMWRTAGKIGEYGTRVEWRRLGGSSRQITPKLRVTDPVPLVIVSACINPEN